jgi:ESCRT-II complex subunit VPS25
MESTSTSTVASRLAATTTTKPVPTSSTPRLTLTRYVSPTSHYTFPSLYSFPPFFTKQPNLSTWSHQRQQWIQLILSYSKFTKTSYYNLSGNELVESFELFKNQQINRGLNKQVLIDILKHMQTNGGSVEFLFNNNNHNGTTAALVGVGKGSKEITGCYVYWKTPLEWAETLYNWIRETGQQNSILTFYELTEQDPSLGKCDHLFYFFTAIVESSKVLM